jgi:hypothetical protein
MVHGRTLKDPDTLRFLKPDEVDHSGRITSSPLPLNFTENHLFDILRRSCPSQNEIDRKGDFGYLRKNVQEQV